MQRQQQMQLLVYIKGGNDRQNSNTNTIFQTLLSILGIDGLTLYVLLMIWGHTKLERALQKYWLVINGLLRRVELNQYGPVPVVILIPAPLLSSFGDAGAPKVQEWMNDRSLDILQVLVELEDDKRHYFAATAVHLTDITSQFRTTFENSFSRRGCAV